MQSLQIYVFGPKNSQRFLRGGWSFLLNYKLYWNIALFIEKKIIYLIEFLRINFFKNIMYFMTK